MGKGTSHNLCWCGGLAHNATTELKCLQKTVVVLQGWGWPLKDILGGAITIYLPIKIS